jgi:hypothetical protein
MKKSKKQNIFNYCLYYILTYNTHTFHFSLYSHTYTIVAHSYSHILYSHIHTLTLALHSHTTLISHTYTLHHTHKSYFHFILSPPCSYFNTTTTITPLLYHYNTVFIPSPHFYNITPLIFNNYL